MTTKTRTPWGVADSVTPLAKGITQVTTPRHGGIRVSAGRLKQMPEVLRRSRGWYEEDCEWSLVVLAFPDEFPADKVAQARLTAKRWYPDEYQAVTGETLTAADSHVLAEREFRAAHANSYVGVAAWGDWEVGVPEGMVKVFVVRGGRNVNFHFASDDRAYFLVPGTEYEQRSSFGFVVDEARHQRIAG